MTILQPNADHDDMSGAELDLTRYVQKEWRHGAITALLTWTLHNREPALVLVPSDKPRRPGVIIPCVIPLASAYKWNPASNDAPAMRELYKVLRMFAPALSLNPDSDRDLFTMIRIVQDHLDDLVALPPFNVTDFMVSRAVAAVEIGNRREEKTIDELEIIDHV